VTLNNYRYLKIGYPFIQALSQTRSMTCIHAPPHKLYIWTTPPCRGGLQRHHVSHDPVLRLLVEVSSATPTCPSAPVLASLTRWAPVLTCVPWLRALPSWEGISGAATCLTARDSTFLRGELWCCHVSHGSWQAVDHMNKKKLSCPRVTCSCVTEAPARHACRYSVAL
jgi:hypothetical protein